MIGYHVLLPGPPEYYIRLDRRTDLSVTRTNRQAETECDCDSCEPSRAPGDFSTGARENAVGACLVRRRNSDRFGGRSLVDDLDVGDQRRDGLDVFNLAGVDEVPSFRGLLGPVRFTQHSGRRSASDVVLGVSRHCVLVGNRSSQRVAVFVDHLLPDGEVHAGFVRLQPVGVVGVLGFTEHAFFALGQVDGLVRYCFLHDDLFDVGLDPLGVDRHVTVDEEGGLRLHRGLPQVALGVLGEVEGLVGSRFLSHLSLRLPELLPAVERRVLEPSGFCHVGRRGPVGLSVLGVGVGRFVLDDLLGGAELLPAVERRVLEPGGLRDICCHGAVGLAVLGERGDVDLVGLRHRSAELGPASERRLLEPSSFRYVGGGSAVSLAVFRTSRNRSAVDDLALVDLDPRSARGVRCPSATLVGGDDDLGLGVTRGGVCTGVGRRPVGPRTVVGVAAVDGDEAGVVRRVDVRSAVGRQVHVPLRVRFAASQVLRRNSTASPHDVDDRVGNGVPACADNPVAGNGLVADLGGSAGHEVVPLDELAFNGVVGAFHAVAEAVLRDRLLVLVLLVRLFSLTGNGTRELLRLVRRRRLAGVLTREAVLLVRDLRGCGDLVVEAVLLVRDLLEAGDELFVQPLLVRDFRVAGDVSGVLDLLVRHRLDCRNHAAPALFVVDDGDLAGHRGRVDVPKLIVVHDTGVGRLVDALVGRAGCCRCRCCCAHKRGRGDCTDKCGSADTVRKAVQLISPHW